jgi:rhodanese-related sulfurtransferase
MSQIRTITPRALHERLSSEPEGVLIDVRTPEEFERIHAAGARLHPLSDFDPQRVMHRFGAEGLGKTRPVYLTCLSGVRATEAAQRLGQRGYDNVYLLDGGTQAWVDAKLPVVRGRRVLSLERQVQITLGVLVVLKVIFGVAVHPIFFGLLAALGAGLVIAGITQSCTLAKLLSAMPWNRRAAQAVHS